MKSLIAREVSGSKNPKRILKYISSLAVLLLLSFQAITYGASLVNTNGLLLRKIPLKTSITTQVKEDVEYDHIVVKFREGMGVNLQYGQLSLLNTNPDFAEKVGTDWTGVNSYISSIMDKVSNNNLQLGKLFKANRAFLESLKQKGEERSGKQLADLTLYFEIPLQSWYSSQYVEGLVAFFNNMPIVEIAYAVPVTEVASITATTDTPDYENQQGYRDPAPNGIDINYAWQYQGGKGDGVKVVDVEQGWNSDHEDLPQLFHQNGSISTSSINHGTAVLGVMSSQDNGYGTTGLIPEAAIGYESHRGIGVAAAITNAADAVGEGGIVLIEVHRKGPETASCTCNDSQCNYIPVEYWQAEFDAIQTVTANGVIVVEAAGNGSANLDDPAYEDAFDKSVRDSGAILVGGSYAYSRRPKCWTNFGSRVDVHGWGEKVVTLGYGTLYTAEDEEDQDKWYASNFTGTSSASPIVVGAAASLQGIAINNLGRYLSPKEVRYILSETGTEQETATSSSQNIGSLPNLKNAVDYLLDDNYSTCNEITATLSSHEAAGRVYTESVQGWWWMPSTVTYYLEATGEELGTNGSTTVTMKENNFSGDYYLGSCSDSNDNAPEITSADFEVNVNSITVTGQATDEDGDIEVVYLEVNGDLYECEGTTTFTCESDNLADGSYTAYVFAEDSQGNESDSYGSNQLQIGGVQNSCVTSTNYEHVNSGRAYSQAAWWVTNAIANGSGDNLGSVGTQWYSATTSLEETSSGYWVQVNSCN